METIILGLVVLSLTGLALWYYNRDSRGLDVNQDGRIDVKDAVTAAKKAATGITQDAREVRDLAVAAASESAAKATVAVEKAAQKAKSTAKKVAARKPRAKK